MERRVEALQKQFEFQFNNGQALTEELNSMRHQLEKECAAGERAQGELEGFRMINSQQQFSPQV